MDSCSREIRIACIDVYDEPGNPAARAALAALLGRTETPRPALDEDDLQRLRIACTDLYDEPHSGIARRNVTARLFHPPEAAPPSSAERNLHRDRNTVRPGIYLTS